MKHLRPPGFTTAADDLRKAEAVRAYVTAPTFEQSGRWSALQGGKFRPLALHETIARILPASVMRMLDRLHLHREGHNWHSAAYLPATAVESVIRSTVGAPPGKPGTPCSPGSTTLAALTLAAAAWRIGKGSYQFDDDLARAVIDTTPERIPADALSRLPEWAVHIAPTSLTPGFWATAYANLHDKSPSLCIVRDAPEYPVHLLSCDGEFLPELATVRSNLELEILATPEKVAAQTGLPLSVIKSSAGILRKQAEEDSFLPKAVALILYLCSEEPDYSGVTIPPPQKPAAKPAADGTSLRIPITKDTRVWNVGMRLGAAFRAYAAAHAAREPGPEGEGGGTAPRPHLRRAHWHAYWTGPKSDPEQRKLSLRWLAPIPVNLNGETPVTIRPVTKSI